VEYEKQLLETRKRRRVRDDTEAEYDDDDESIASPTYTVLSSSTAAAASLSDSKLHTTKKGKLKHATSTIEAAIKSNTVFDTFKKQQLPSGFRDGDFKLQTLDRGTYELRSNDDHPQRLVKTRLIKIGKDDDMDEWSLHSDNYIDEPFLLESLIMQSTQSKLFPTFVEYGLVEIVNDDADDESSIPERVWIAYIVMDHVTAITYQNYMNEHESKHFKQQCGEMWFDFCQEHQKLVKSHDFISKPFTLDSIVVQDNRIQIIDFAKCCCTINGVTYYFTDTRLSEFRDSDPTVLALKILLTPHPEWFDKHTKKWILSKHNLESPLFLDDLMDDLKAIATGNNVWKNYGDEASGDGDEADGE